MTNELQLYADPSEYSGETVVAKLYEDGAQVGADIATAEVGATGHFLGDMPTIARGAYAVIFYKGADIIGQGEIIWSGTSEVDWWVVRKIQSAVDAVISFVS